MKASTTLRRFILTSMLLSAATSADAQTSFYWDSDGNATTGTGGSGVWDSGSSLWRSGSATGTLAQWPNTDPAIDYAQLEGTAGTLTLNSDSVNLNVNRIIFGTTGYEIAGPVSGTAAVNLTGTAPRITTNNSVNATVSANISGSTGLSKTGAGTLNLSGSNSYTGTTTVSSNNTSGGIVNVSGDQSAADGGWIINGDSTVNFLSGSKIAVGAGKSITLANVGNSANFALNVYGTVTAIAKSGLVVRGRRALNLESGADWTQNGDLTIQPLNTTYGATVNVKTGASLTYAGTSNIILAKSTSSAAGGATLTLSGGTFTTSKGLSNTNSGTGSGTTRLNFSNGGTLKLSADIPSLIIQGTSTFEVFTNNSAGGVIDTNGFNTEIGAAVSGVGGLTKAGAGGLTLSGSNPYSGNTSVTGGTLYVTGALSNSAVIVGANGTIASNGSAGTLGNGLTLEDGGDLDLSGATIGLNSTGILSLTGGSLTLGNLTFQNLIGWDWMAAAPGTYELIDGLFSVNWGNTAYLTPETAYDFNNGNKGYFTSGSLNVVIIPEPSSVLLGGLGLLALLRRRRVA